MNAEYLPLLNYLYFIIIPIIMYFIIFNYIFNKLKIKKQESRSFFLQEEPPDNLTPIEVGYIMSGVINSDFISAELIYLKTIGYLKIKEIDKENYGFPYRLRNNYEFTLLKDIKLMQSYADREILRLLFKSSAATAGSINKLSDSMLSHFFGGNADIPFVSMDQMDKMLVSKEYYNSFSSPCISKHNTKLILGISFTVSILIFSFYYLFYDNLNYYFITSILLLPICFLVCYYGSFLVSKTPKGLALFHKIYNYKDFLKDEINNINDSADNIQKNIDIFEKHFPYAVSLGLGDEWINKFKNMNIKSPSWFGEQGKNNTIEDILLFSSVINKM